MTSAGGVQTTVVVVALLAVLVAANLWMARFAGSRRRTPEPAAPRVVREVLPAAAPVTDQESPTPAAEPGPEPGSSTGAAATPRPPFVPEPAERYLADIDPDARNNIVLAFMWFREGRYVEGSQLLTQAAVELYASQDSLALDALALFFAETITPKGLPCPCGADHPSGVALQFIEANTGRAVDNPDAASTPDQRASVAAGRLVAAHIADDLDDTQARAVLAAVHEQPEEDPVAAAERLELFVSVLASVAARQPWPGPRRYSAAGRRPRRSGSAP